MEHRIAARAVKTYEALTSVVDERHLVVDRADARHLTLAFRQDEPEQDGAPPVVLCTVLDVGHGNSKLVLSGTDEADTRTIGLVADVEERIRDARERQAFLAEAS